jgi:hypothetical protein
MSKDLLRSVGEFFYGAEWQAPLARDIGVNERSLRRWIAGTENVPNGVWNDLSTKLGIYKNGLGIIAGEVNRAAGIVSPPSVTQHVEAMFQVARQKSGQKHQSWIDLSTRLAGRVAVSPMLISLQRAGDLDLSLRAMEDEAAARKDQPTGHSFAFHYQMMLSETWIIVCYEALRALKQREEEAAETARAKKWVPAQDDISASPTFRQIFADLELLLMPMAKYEIAKDTKLKSPLTMRAMRPNGNNADDKIYDKDDPARSHIMPTALSERRSAMWLVLDHSVPKEYWVERRDLSDRLLALNDEIEPAGLSEARLAIEAASLPRPVDPV